MRLAMLSVALVVFESSAFAAPPEVSHAFEARGVVRDAHFHKPIAGATVFDTCESCPAIARTDEKGAFVIRLKDGLDRHVQIDAPGYASEVFPIRAGGSITAELALGAFVSGRVQTESGAPVAGATVTCKLEQYVSGAEVSAHTDATGHFTIDGCAAAHGAIDGTELRVSHANFSAAQSIGKLTAGARLEDVAIVVKPAFSVRGTVLGADHHPVGNALLIVLDHGTDQTLARTWRKLTAGSDGRFEFAIPKGSWTLAAVGPDGLATAREISVDGPITADVDLPRGVTITGRLRVGKDPVAGARVTLQMKPDTKAAEAQMNQEDPGVYRYTQTRDDGTFEVPNMTPGHYWLTATHELTGKINRTFSSDEPMLIDLPVTGSIEVSVVSADGSLPSGRIFAAPHDPPKPPPPRPGSPVPAPSPANSSAIIRGYSFLAGLPEGTYDVFPVPEKTALQFPPTIVEVKAGAPTPHIAIRMPKGTKLRGRILSPTGTPVVSARISVSASTGLPGAGGAESVLTDAEGRFSVPEVLGRVQIQVADPVLAQCYATIDVGPEETDIGDYELQALDPKKPWIYMTMCAPPKTK